MAIKIPNTLEPANNDFPVVSSDHIDVDGLDKRTNLTQHLKDVYAELTNILEINHAEDRADRYTKHNSIGYQLTDLRKLLLLSLFGNETYEPSNEDNVDGSGRNITNKIRDLDDKFSGLLGNDGSDSIKNILDTLSSTVTTSFNDMSNKLTQDFSNLKYDVKNFNERIIIRSIDKHFNNGISTADINIFCDLQDDETIFVKSASTNYLNKTISLSENILLDDGSNLEEGTVNNDLNIITLNNGENMILIKDIQLNTSTPTDVTICILRQGQIAYKKNIEIMRKAPVYVGYSSEESISFNTTDQNYLVDSLYGELTIPAHKDDSGIDKYLYVGIPKTYFSEKTVETGSGSTDIKLQLLQNGFSVGSFLEETGDYYIYRSSQKISEHSNLELK